MHNTMKATFLAAVLGFLLMTCSTAHARQPVEFEQATVVLKGQPYTVEYAKSMRQRAQGLMFRKSLCDDCGMLFQFSPPKQASMWMKNTFVALDVAYIDSNGVITDIKPLQPHDLNAVAASTKVLYALEMNQGWFAQQGIKVGDSVTIKP